MQKDFLEAVGDVMEDSVFKEFFDTYFNDWDEIVATVMLLKAYQQLSEDAPTGVTKEQKVAFLRKCMRDGKFREQLASGMVRFMDNMKLTRAGSQLRLLQDRDEEDENLDKGYDGHDKDRDKANDQEGKST